MLLSDCADAQADPSFRWALKPFCHEVAQIYINEPGLTISYKAVCASGEDTSEPLLPTDALVPCLPT